MAGAVGKLPIGHPSEAWAAAAGAQPLTVYALGLLLAVGVGLCLPRLVLPARARAGALNPGEPAALATPGRGAGAMVHLGLRLGLAAAVLLAAGLAVTAMGGLIAAHGAVGRWDDAFTAAMAPHRSPALLAVFALLSHAGDALLVTAIGAVVAVALWRAQHRLLALAWAVALAGNGVFTRVFKALWARDRPVHEHALAVVSGHSFPSGHASASAVMYLWLACLGCWLLPARWRLPAAVLACALAWTVAFSRVVLNVHYASDVLTGMLLGTAWAAASGLAVRGLLQWRRAGRAVSA